MRIFLVIVFFISFLHSYEIKSGWNLIGTTKSIYILSDEKLSDKALTESIWKFEDGAWSSYSTNSVSNSLMTLNSGDGFWLKSKGSYTSPFISSGGDSFTLDIKKGWNLLSSKNGKDFKAETLGVENTWVYRDNSWLLYPEYSNIATFDTIKAGEGTFIYSSSAKSVTISGSTDAPPSVPTVVTDTTTNSTTTTTQDSSNAYSGAEINGDGYTLLAWTDLGMHCLDDDFSIFSILPPYSTLRAQLINKKSNDLVKSGVTLTFEATTKDGKINSTSENKTNFWSYVEKLFNSVIGTNIGLTGYTAQSLTPQVMKYSDGYFEAEGIPTTPYNDDGSKDTYPMVRVVAKDSSGNVLATTKAVLPVSDEMDCRACHSSNSNSEAKPYSGWENASDSTKDYRLNILKLHDEKHNIARYLDEVKTKGYEYQDSLYDTAKSGTPILCVVCHKSNALKTSGVSGVPQFTTAMHSLHAKVKHPTSGEVLGDSASKDSCYMCHPGSDTKCQRGAMNSVNCQECHGGLNAVGSYHREGWVDLPNCQSCHQNGKRYTSAVIDSMGTLRDALDDRFSTGTKLYKNAKGHGGLNCQACHGSTHATYPSLKAEDNFQSIQLMGNAGTIGDCSVCHESVPFTTGSGPHGMHSISQTWVSRHGHYAEDSTSSCKVCHGSDLRGSDLSKTLSDRSYNIEHGTKTFTKAHKVSCYDCHNGVEEEHDD